MTMELYKVTKGQYKDLIGTVDMTYVIVTGKVFFYPLDNPTVRLVVPFENIKEYQKTSNGKGSVSLSISNKDKDKKLIEFSDDGPIVCPLGDDLDDYNIIKFSTKA